MSFKRYYTINGLIIGERSGGGTRINYAPDAVGSVVATISGSAIQNTYVYKPYGSLLQSSGPAVDPSFMWVGAHGYRATLRTYAETYVRLRTLAANLARWTSVDPLWPASTNQPIYRYAYVNGSPASLADPMGLNGDAFLTGDAFPRTTYKYDWLLEAMNDALDLCGNEDPIACKGVNDQLPPCTKDNPNWARCGDQIGWGANKSNYPEPIPQCCWTDFFFGEYCCLECEMRVCCDRGPKHPRPRNPRPNPTPQPEPVPVPEIPEPGSPIPGAHGGIKWT